MKLTPREKFFIHEAFKHYLEAWERNNRIMAGDSKTDLEPIWRLLNRIEKEWKIKKADRYKSIIEREQQVNP